MIGVKAGYISKNPWTVLHHVLPLITKLLAAEVKGCVDAILKKPQEGVELADELADMTMSFADRL
jgi:hypothetical protein